jgi:hypothetical protein
MARERRGNAHQKGSPGDYARQVARTAKNITGVTTESSQD